MDEIVTIHVRWEGPILFEDINTSCEKYDRKQNQGIYQIYGPSNTYGNNSLLYIGKTEKQTFTKRLKKEEYSIIDNHNLMQYFLGRISGEYEISNRQYLIDVVETLLIAVHQPSNNASKLKINLDKYEKYRIYNWDNYNRLLPELSGDRYTAKYWTDNNYNWDYIKY